MQYCACGFTDDSIELDEIGARSLAAVTTIGSALRDNPEVALRRPQVDRWSMVEYAAHTRDVLITIRDRMVVGLVENNPGFTPMYRDERIDLGLYATDSASVVADEIAAAQTMFARLFLQIDPTALDRQVRYGSPDAIDTTIGWMAKQAVHESEHHLADIRENLGTLSAA